MCWDCCPCLRRPPLNRQLRPAQTKFEDFSEAFAGSSEIQRAFTAQDVDVTEIDSNAQPEPRETTVNRAHADLRFPIIPTLAEQRQAGLETLVSQMENGDVRARLHKPDTGYQIAYVFRSRGACWELHAMADTSL